MNNNTIQELFIAAGPTIIPIMICSIAALTIIIKKYNDLRSINRSSKKLKKDVFVLIKNNKITAAIEICEKTTTPAGRILKTGLMQFGNSREQIQEAVRTAVALEIPLYERGLVPLITITHLSPLFGILGTVIGLTMIFQTMSIRATSLTPVTMLDVTTGAWQALLATIAGLTVAIPSFAAHNYFVTCVNQHLNDLDRTGEELIFLLTSLNEYTSKQSNDAF